MNFRSTMIAAAAVLALAMTADPAWALKTATGKIIGKNGSGVGGATISLKSSTGRVVGTATTRPDGSYEIQVKDEDETSCEVIEIEKDGKKEEARCAGIIFTSGQSVQVGFAAAGPMYPGFHLGGFVSRQISRIEVDGQQQGSQRVTNSETTGQTFGGIEVQFGNNNTRIRAGVGTPVGSSDNTIGVGIDSNVSPARLTYKTNYTIEGDVGINLYEYGGFHLWGVGGARLAQFNTEVLFDQFGNMSGGSDTSTIVTPYLGVTADYHVAAGFYLFGAIMCGIPVGENVVNFSDAFNQDVSIRTEYGNVQTDIRFGGKVSF